MDGLLSVTHLYFIMGKKKRFRKIKNRYGYIDTKGLGSWMEIEDDCLACNKTMNFEIDTDQEGGVVTGTCWECETEHEIAYEVVINYIRRLKPKKDGDSTQQA